jgi:hypothetical protein
MCTFISSKLHFWGYSKIPGIGWVNYFFAVKIISLRPQPLVQIMTGPLVPVEDAD